MAKLSLKLMLSLQLLKTFVNGYGQCSLDDDPSTLIYTCLRTSAAQMNSDLYITIHELRVQLLIISNRICFFFSINLSPNFIHFQFFYFR